MFAPQTPIVLVGCKSDLRSRDGVHTISQSQCEMLKRRIKATSYRECSTKEGFISTSAVFSELIIQGLRYKEARKLTSRKKRFDLKGITSS